MNAYEISKALHDMYWKSNSACLHNCYSWGGYESDFLQITSSLYMNEFEIKIDRWDYKRDFTKNRKHPKIKGGRSGLNTFTFVAPVGLVKDWEVPVHAGLIEFHQNKWGKIEFKTKSKSPKLPNPKKISTPEMYRLLKNMTYRHYLKDVKEL